MSTKTFIWIGLFIGSTVGSFIPLVWGGSLISFSGIVLSGVGAIGGMWAGYQAGKYF